MFFKFPDTRNNAWLWYNVGEYFIWRNTPKLQKMGHRLPDVTCPIGQGPDQGVWFPKM